MEKATTHDHNKITDNFKGNFKSIYEMHRVRDCEKEYAYSEELKDAPQIGEKGLKAMSKTVASFAPEVKTANVKERLDLTLYGTLLALEHFVSNAWTSEASIKLGKDAMASIMKVYEAEKFCDFLMKTVSSKTVARVLLDECSVQLKKSTWKSKPALMASCAFIIREISFPNTSYYIGDSLRITLLYLDDFETHNKLEGVRLGQHLLDNTSKSELRWNGRADVLYDALQHQLYMNDTVLLHALLPCLLSCALIVSENPRVFSAGVVRVPQKLDDVFRRMLINLELEVNEKNKVVYLTHLSAYIEQLGICVLRHFHQLKKILIMLLEEREASSTDTKVKTLSVLQTVLRQAWPRMPRHMPELFMSVGKMVIDLDKSIMSNEEYLVIKEAKTVFNLMAELAPDPIISYITELCECLEHCKSDIQSSLV